MIWSEGLPWRTALEAVYELPGNKKRTHKAWLYESAIRIQSGIPGCMVSQLYLEALFVGSRTLQIVSQAAGSSACQIWE